MGYLMKLRYAVLSLRTADHSSPALSSRSVSFSTTGDLRAGARTPLRDLRTGMGVEFPLLNFLRFVSVAVLRSSRGVEGGRCCCCCCCFSPGLGVEDLRRAEKLSALRRRSGVVKKVDFEGIGSGFRDMVERFLDGVKARASIRQWEKVN